MLYELSFIAFSDHIQSFLDFRPQHLHDLHRSILTFLERASACTSYTLTSHESTEKTIQQRIRHEKPYWLQNVHTGLRDPIPCPFRGNRPECRRLGILRQQFVGLRHVASYRLQNFYTPLNPDPCMQLEAYSPEHWLTKPRPNKI